MNKITNKIFFGFLLVLALSGVVPVSHAVLQIEITQGVEGALPIAIVPFTWQGNPNTSPPENIATIVSNDLYRSGLFAPMAVADMPVNHIEAGKINFAPWRAMGIENLVIGEIKPVDGRSFEISFRLFDVFKGQQLSGFKIPSSYVDLRGSGHYISDIVYERLTGEKGAFSTRIAYISALAGKPKRYVLQVADADGFNAQTILESTQPLMSPAWSSDGRSLAYVSFESNRSAIYVQGVYSGKRTKIASFKGINGAPAWSPDGTQLALTLSKDGNPEIYIMELASKKLTRITRSYGIDTEPAWSPDGNTLVFTSDRGGKPHIYKVPSRGGKPERLTFEGDYNARAVFSPDGKRIAMIHGDQGRFRIAVQELKTGEVTVLTDNLLDESPSFAPNGSMIIYASSHGRRGVLAAVSVDGRVRQRLALQEGDVREPVWSPFNK